MTERACLNEIPDLEARVKELPEVERVFADIFADFPAFGDVRNDLIVFRIPAHQAFVAGGTLQVADETQGNSYLTI